jgi:SAM-dependent methyltransferase
MNASMLPSAMVRHDSIMAMTRALPLLLFLALATAAAPAAAQDNDVPFITTPDNVTLEMLSAARVAPGDHVIDLGSGDGRIVITAARRFGATGLGVEIDPSLVKRSIANAQAAGVAARVRFLEQDLFRTDLAPATVVTMYLLPEVNLQLRPSLLALKPGTRIVSHDWDMGDWLADRTTVVPVPDKQLGLEKSSKVHLWIVPAQVAGLWCSPSGALEVSQRYQQVQASFAQGRGATKLEGRINGAELLATSGTQGSVAMEASRDTLRVTSAAGALGALQGTTFRRAAGQRCP